MVDESRRARDDQEQVARFATERVAQPELLALAQELRHRRVERAVLQHAHPHQARGAELLRAVDELVDLRPRHRALTREPHALHRRRLERAELGGGEHLAQVAELEPEAHVGLVGAVDLHRVVPRHPLDGAGARAGDLLRRVEDRLADHRHHVVGGREAHLGVELHELELPVGAQVFVAEAAGDLVVAVEAADHQQLLEELRALRQRVERPGRQARRHHEVARAFRGGGDEHRRLDLDEPLRVERPAQRRVHAGADAEVALHARTAQVEIAVPQPEHFVGVDAVVDRERHGLGLAQHLEDGRADLHLAGGKRRR